MRSVLLLLTGAVGLWALLALPAWLLGGSDEMVVSAAALALCLVPAALTLPLLVGSATTATGDLLAVAAAPLFRLAVVCGGVLILTSRVSLFQGRPGFAAWVLLFYFLFLGLEVWLALRPRPAGAPLREDAR